MKKICENIKNAYNILDNVNYSDSYNLIYAFSTENIKGYYDLLDIRDKSFLTVGSSIDQALSAHLYNAKKVDIFDINPFIKYYSDLKKAAIINLDFDNFLNFFTYYINIFKRNNNSFDYETYKYLKNDLDYESLLFWTTIFSNYKNIIVRKKLFSSDELNLKTLERIIPYLNVENYYILKRNINSFKPTFLNTNLTSLHLNIKDKYDIINISNIAHNIEKMYNNNIYGFRDNISLLLPYLNNDGIMILAYLYDFDKNTKYKNNWDIIHNIPLVKDLFGNIELLTFDGVDNKSKDSVLIYKK